ncbi:hypothetical protein Vretifemale_13893 [Volvox reticuliferus]|uniref:Uncharacterized protein n=1 Tax=Volvox reticuliferus TaxID=1737510 RepID=A0A8J4CRJ4_9CHLO|nr:hypothetical protein Vretifemale_13893 [Volvox reticuliferus]
MIASFTCVPVEPLPFTCLTYTAHPDSCAYHRQEDRSFVTPGAQFISGQGQPPLTFGPMGHTGSDGVGPVATGAVPAGPSGVQSVGAGAADVTPPAWHSNVPGTFRPAIISETALAMRRVCRLWCQVLSDGVRRVLLPGRDSFTLWASHFPNISHLALGCCTDLRVRSHDQPAVPSPRCRGAGAGGDDQPGPGPSSAAAAAAASTTSRGRRRSARAAVTSLSGVRWHRPVGNGCGGCGGPFLKDRSLEALTSLRNLQVNDSAVHLDLAATCPSLEELVVWTQRPARYGTHPGRFFTGFMGLMAGGGGGGGGGTAAAARRHPGGGAAAAAGSSGLVTRRSALDRTLSSLPGLRRLRLSGVDASAARLGSALMELTALTSLRLFQCRLPTFLGAPERARSGHSSFARELVLNLGAKLQDLSLQGCCIRILPDEVLAGLTGLRMLDLSSNWLHSLPGSVTLLQRLEVSPPEEIEEMSPCYTPVREFSYVPWVPWHGSACDRLPRPTPSSSFLMRFRYVVPMLRY